MDGPVSMPDRPFTGPLQSCIAGPRSPSLGENDPSVGTKGWTAPGNVGSHDLRYATVEFSDAGTTNLLKVSRFGFSLPSDAAVRGIVVDWTSQSHWGRNMFHDGNISDHMVQLVRGGKVAGTNHAVRGKWLENGTAYTSYGAATDLWGLLWTPDLINASDFGAALSATYQSFERKDTAEIDHVRVTVHYSAAVCAR